MLAISTVTLNRRPEWLAECVRSVRDQMPVDSVHNIVDGTDFLPAKWSATQVGDYFAWVDDDDLVCNDALSLCVRALEQTGAGVAFTYEQQMDAEGRDLGAPDRSVVHLSDVAMHPRMLHHLAVMRSDALSPHVLDLAAEFGLGIDWLCRAWCALKHGAIQVPIVGYRWRQHQHPHHHQLHREEGALYLRAMPALQRVIHTWMKHDAPIGRLLPR